MQSDQLQSVSVSINAVDGIVREGAPVVFRRFSETPHQTTYIDETTHAPNARNMVQLKRSLPVRAGQFRGALRSAIKLTRDHTVATASGDAELVSPLIVELSVSVPMGMKLPEGVTQKMEILRAVQDVFGLFNAKVDLPNEDPSVIYDEDEHLNQLFLIGEI